MLPRGRRMTHVRKGRDFEAALKHWVDPAVYAALVDHKPGRERSELEVFYLERGTDLGLTQRAPRPQALRVADIQAACRRDAAVERDG